MTKILSTSLICCMLLPRFSAQAEVELWPLELISEARQDPALAATAVGLQPQGIVRNHPELERSLHSSLTRLEWDDKVLLRPRSRF